MLGPNSKTKHKSPKEEDVSKLLVVKPRILLLFCSKKLKVHFLTLFHLFIVQHIRAHNRYTFIPVLCWMGL